MQDASVIELFRPVCALVVHTIIINIIRKHFSGNS
jgi:hypothetical protein